MWVKIILFNLMVGRILSSKTSVLAIATRHQIQEDDILIL
jgi:hypothetical protein